MKKTLLKVNIYTEYRVFTELKYLNLYGCNAYPKSNHEIASVEAIVYERVHKCLIALQNKRVTFTYIKKVMTVLKKILLSMLN